MPLTNSSENPPTSGWLLAVNGNSGSADADTIDAVEQRLERSGPVERRESSQPEDLDRMFADLEGRVLVVVGGDGSIHTAVRRALACGELDRITFGLVPTGTGNDLARTLEIPLDPVEAADALLTATPRALDLLAWDDGEVVVNAAHAGIGADAAERAQPMKEQVGALAYPVGAVAAGVAVDGWDVSIEVDGEPLHPAQGDRVLMIAMGNGCTIGGGTPVCADAAPDDGGVDVLVSTAVSPGARAAFAAALMRGEHADRDDVAVARGSEVTVRGQAIPYNVDGELVGEATARTFRVQPAAWRLLTP